MARVLSLFRTVMVVLLLLATSAARAADLKPEDLVDRYGAAVALITVEREGGGKALGTGFFVTDRGLLTTNLHVVRGALSVVVRLAGNRACTEVSVVGYDEQRDLAVLQVKGARFPKVVLGDSDALRVGAKVYVIGNPKGLENQGKRI